MSALLSRVLRLVTWEIGLYIIIAVVVLGAAALFVEDRPRNVLDVVVADEIRGDEHAR